MGKRVGTYLGGSTIINADGTFASGYRPKKKAAAGKPQRRVSKIGRDMMMADQHKKLVWAEPGPVTVTTPRKAKMPTGPKGQKRKADVIGNAVLIARIATGEVDDDVPDDGKDPAAKALGKKGGAARAKSMTPERRAEIAKKAAAKRWGKAE